MVALLYQEHPDGVSYELVEQWNQQGIIRYHGETEDILYRFLAEADCLLLPYLARGYLVYCWRQQAWAAPSSQPIM